MDRLTSRETKVQLDALLENPQTLYQGNIVNKRGRSRTNEIPYSEIVAKRLLHTHDFPQVLRQLPKVPNGQLTRPADHDGTTLDPTILGIEQEDRVAVALYNHKSLGSLGTVIDYLVPIAMDGRTIGTIDLVAFDPSHATLTIIGYVFHETRRDTLLRCVLEIATLQHSIDPFRFARLYEDLLKDGQGNVVRPQDVTVRSAVLVLEGSYQDKSIAALRRMPHVADLIQELQVGLYAVGIKLELNDKPRFTRKHAAYPYRPVLHFLPVLKERSLPVI
ncbi:MAG: hypothetical protein WCY74_04525 [Sphaerochaetaceae bacterium]|jgi:hypothetical protein|nr:hypothetical protein [Sphaerochaetaceae bacterium]MDX9940190.1 hypothetical protein [Sphaerochaetaceae bacterium]